MTDRSVLISGAGIAGPTLAYWLARRGFVPTIVERAPALRTGGYMIDFWGLGWDVAERMGIVPRILRDGYTMREVRLVDTNGKRVASLDASVYRTTGKPFTSVLRSDLAKAIFATIDGDVETIFGDAVASLHQDERGVDVTFERGAQRRFDLAIGADGLHSSVRTRVFGPTSRFETYLGYGTASFSVAGYPKRDDDVYLSYCAPGRQVARYSLRDDRTVFFFVFVQPGGLDAVHHDVAAQRAFLRRTYDGAGWETPAILEAMERSDDLYFDAISQIHMENWHDGRIALVGDAVACPSLLAGQGSSFAMAGAYLLAGELEAAGDDYAAAFARYQAAFKPFVTKKQKGALALGGWFAPRTRFGVTMRNLTTNLMGIRPFSGWMVNAMMTDAFSLPAFAG